MSYSFHSLTRQDVGRNATSSSPLIRTFSNCCFVDISVSFKEKQDHFKLHLTWARGTQFGEGPVLAVHLSECCSEHSAMATYLFDRSGLKHYSRVHLLMPFVKFNGISGRTPELEHLPWTVFIRCVWNILFPIKAPFAKKCSFSDFWIFCLLPSTKSVPMYLVTC